MSLRSIVAVFPHEQRPQPYRETPLRECAGIIKNDAHRVFTALMIRGFIPVRWWKKQEAVLQKVLLLYPDAMYVM